MLSIRPYKWCMSRALPDPIRGAFAVRLSAKAKERSAPHPRFTQLRAMGRKVSDEFTVPLCRTHHRNNHRFSDEQAWWDSSSINPVEVSRKLCILTRRIE